MLMRLDIACNVMSASYTVLSDVDEQFPGF